MHERDKEVLASHSERERPDTWARMSRQAGPRPRVLQILGQEEDQTAQGSLLSGNAAM